LQNQSVWYIQKGLDGEPWVLLDPNKFSKDGTSRLGSFTISHTGKYAGYGISEGGSDWNEIHVLDVVTRKPLEDTLKWVKFSGASWRGDEGFYYNRFPVPAEGKKMAAKNEYQKVYYHKIGTPQSGRRSGV
jgi:prolyl oligopeptidase